MESRDAIILRHHEASDAWRLRRRCKSSGRGLVSSTSSARFSPTRSLTPAASGSPQALDTKNHLPSNLIQPSLWIRCCFREVAFHVVPGFAIRYCFQARGVNREIVVLAVFLVEVVAQVVFQTFWFAVHVCADLVFCWTCSVRSLSCPCGTWLCCDCTGLSPVHFSLRVHPGVHAMLCTQRARSLPEKLFGNLITVKNQQIRSCEE